MLEKLYDFRNPHSIIFYINTFLIILITSLIIINFKKLKRFPLYSILILTSSMAVAFGNYGLHFINFEKL
jgi:hypothetical protein